MNISENINYWLASAEHDFITAESMFALKHYDWCLFIGHLVVEKTLKAHYVRDNRVFPPKTHDLILLASKVNYSFSEEELIILEQTNNFNLEARYPDEKLTFYKVCNMEYTEKHFNNIKKMYQCLKSDLK